MKYEFVYLPVKKIEKKKLARAKRLYNFAVNKNESYIVRGIVVHNCRCSSELLGPEMTKVIQGDDEQ